jgi:cell division protein FtsW
VTATAPPRARRAAPGSRPPLGRIGPAWLDGPMTSCHLVLGAAGLLLAIGLVMVFSASAMEAALEGQSAWAPGAKQLVLAGVGLCAMLVALRLPTGFVRRWSPIALLLVLVLLVLVLIPGIGQQRNGARQWISLGFTDFQPSELAKLVFALWGAHVLALRERYLTTRSLLVPVLPVFGVLALLVLAERDFGGVVTLLMVLVGLLWAGGMRLRLFGLFAAVGAVLLAAMVAIQPYRWERITSFLDPFAAENNAGFQAVRGMYALAEGGFWGVGLGNSRMKWKLLPEAESDYIFAIIGEELGFLGCVVVVALYGVLAWAGFRIARRSADRFVQLASVAITVWLIGQATVNMGYVVGLLPVTGVTLPLISAGGTSLVLTLFIVGLLARFARAEPAAVEAQQARTRGRLARWLVPVPAAPVDPVRLRRSPGDRPARRSAVGSGRTVVSARGAEPRPRADRRPEPGDGRAPAAGRPSAAERRTPVQERRPAAGERRRSAPPPHRPGTTR